MWPGREAVTVRSVVETDSDTEMGTGRYHRSANGRLVGILLIGLGVVWFLSEIGGLSGETMRAVVLMLLGAGLIYTARRSRGGGRSLWPIALGVILIFSLLGNARSGRRVGPVILGPDSCEPGELVGPRFKPSLDCTTAPSPAPVVPTTPATPSPKP
jgi:hypothetical protein